MAKGGSRQAMLQQLAEEIRATLIHGLPQDRASLDAVCTALDESDIAAALARLAADPDSSEYAPLAALLLSPGPTVLRALEPALVLADLDAAEAEALAALVAQHVLQQGRVLALVPALLPDGSRTELAASSDDLRAFVRRLLPAATAPAELRAVLARRFAANVALELAVLLRHCRLTWTPERVFFLGTLLERVNPDREGLAQDDLPGLLAWAVGFLDIAGLPLNARHALAGRRQALLVQLRQAEVMEEAFARGNYETLMSQGFRFAHVHGPDVRAELAHLERAGLLVLGLRGEALGGVSVRDLGQAEEVDELLRLLPGLDG
jgi:hypothetical protein